ncbi:uncharacterized protein LOC125462962 isoform X2 [Stegostoma tigrinum]|uniref:uncharacterized protein LOC125462962 isoform X2 n=1 Tax=Stegostoma tigrinum TaxID=3053191 RepID=UPI0028700D8D|nr:uncharacterized protein LOC125462962 isoform X2 [Stegostoma tigrinum]
MWQKVTLIVAVFVTVSSSDNPGQCRKPPIVKSAVLLDQYLIQQSFPVGQVVSYECLPGYVWTESTPNVVICQANLTWSEPLISCMPKDCGPPEDLENGYYTVSGHTFGEKATYYCNKGYQLLGKGQILCTDHGWSRSFLSCDLLPDHEEQLSIPSAVTNSIDPTNERTVMIPSLATDGAASQSFPSFQRFLPDHEEQLSIPSAVTNSIDPTTETDALIPSLATDGAASQSFPSFRRFLPDHEEQRSIPSAVTNSIDPMNETDALIPSLATDGAASQSFPPFRRFLPDHEEQRSIPSAVTNSIDPMNGTDALIPSLATDGAASQSFPSFRRFLPDHEEQRSIPSAVTNSIDPMNETDALIPSLATDGAASQSFPPFRRFLPDHEEQRSIPSAVTNSIDPMNETDALIPSLATDGAASQSFPSFRRFLPDHEEQRSIPSAVTNSIDPMNETDALIPSLATDGAASQSFPSFRRSVPEYKDPPSIPSTVTSTMNTVYKTAAQTSILTTDGAETNHVSGSLVGSEDCGPLKELENGYCIVSGQTFGKIATCHCNTGYQLLGRSQILCTIHGWSRSFLFCEHTTTYEQNQTDHSVNTSVNAVINKTMPPNKTQIPTDNFEKRLILESALILFADASPINWPLLISLVSGLMLVIIVLLIIKCIIDRRKYGYYKTGSQFPEYHNNVEQIQTIHI